MSSDEFPHRSVLATNLKIMRVRRNWTQETLSFESGLDRSFIAQIERAAKNVSIDSLARLATAFGVPIHELLMP